MRDATHAVVVLQVSAVLTAGAQQAVTGHGVCEIAPGQGAYPMGVCACEDTFYGADCATRGCPRGLVVKGTPPANCSGIDRGTCRADLTCKCKKGFGGDACEKKVCVDGCVMGKCVEGVCECTAGWKGSNCSVEICPKECEESLGHGRCRPNVGCQCTKDWGGLDCSTPLTYAALGFGCPQNCNGHGECLKSGKCQCATPWMGKNCSTRPFSLDECSLCTSYGCLQKCKMNLAEGATGAATSVNCFSECSTTEVSACLPGTDLHANLKCMRMLKAALADPQALPQDLRASAQAIQQRLQADLASGTTDLAQATGNGTAVL